MSKVATTERILTINGGPCGIRFAAFDAGHPGLRQIQGRVQLQGPKGTTLAFDDRLTFRSGEKVLAGPVIPAFLAWLDEQALLSSVTAIGHRIVHGMHYSAPEPVTPGLLEDLRRWVVYDPEHLPREIALIEAFQERCPEIPQVACFDTAFHAAMPRVAQMLPIPRHFFELGVKRYGFHGLSYAFLMEELARVAGAAAARGRVILAHLGDGASLAAVSQGHCMDTTMGFTPTGGMLMATRSGDLDPGVLLALMSVHGLSPAGLGDVLNQESGLRGLSGTSGDMRALLTRSGRDQRADEAIESFCYQARRWIGASAAVLGGVDTLVFSGEIGANLALIRSAICGPLRFLGIELDENENNRSAALISAPNSRVAVRVMETDEELMIARSVGRTLCACREREAVQASGRVLQDESVPNALATFGTLAGR